jgi:hypothetical protein
VSIRATIATGVLVAATAAGAASGATAGTARLVNCGKLAAAAKSWQVEAAGVSCSTARRVVGQVAAAKPDHVTRGAGGALDQYKASFSGLRCFKSQKANLGGEIQCTSSDGKKSVIAVFRG